VNVLAYLNHDMLVFVVRLFLAAILAGFVGLEREFKQHPAGLRTHLLVGVGSCLMMTLSIYGLETYVEMHENVRFDPARIPSYVISGIGFLGAGTIIVHGRKVRGLTTAASIWVVAGIGLVVGAGMYFEAVLVTLIVVLSLFLLNKIEPINLHKDNRKTLIVYGHELLQLSDIVSTLQASKIEIEKKSVEKLQNDSETQKKFVLQCRYNRNKHMIQAMDNLMAFQHVHKVENGIE